MLTKKFNKCQYCLSMRSSHLGLFEQMQPGVSCQCPVLLASQLPLLSVSTSPLKMPVLWGCNRVSRGVNSVSILEHH